MSSPISRLPPELLLKTLRFVAHGTALVLYEAPRTMTTPHARQWSRLCLVSKTWFDLSEPELYGKVPLWFKVGYFDPSVSPHEPGFEAAPLYQQLVTTPRLAALVRDLNLQMAFLKTIEEQGALGYLLSRIPNLVHLVLPISGISSPILDGILDDLARRTPPLRALGLSIVPDYSGAPYDALARFGGLKKLRVSFFPGDHLFSSRFTRPTFQLTALRLDQSISPSDFLALTFSSQSSLSSLCVALATSHPGYDLAGLLYLRSLTLSRRPTFEYTTWDSSKSGTDNPLQPFRATLSSAFDLPNLITLELQTPLISDSGQDIVVDKDAELVSAADLWTALPASLLYLNLDLTAVFLTDVEFLLVWGKLRFLDLGVVVDSRTSRVVDAVEKEKLDGMADQNGRAIHWGRLEVAGYRRIEVELPTAGVQGNPAPVQRNGQSRRGRRPWR
ncbi:hypothetical protein JCM8547_005616 [Rhodosporidiobolus lusitaniae]